MARAKFCKTNFNADLKKISNAIIRGLEGKVAGEGDIKDIKKLPKNVKKMIKEGVEDIFDGLKKDVNKGDTLEGLTVEALKGRAQRQILDIINTYKATQRMNDHFDLISKNADSEQGVLGALTTLFQEHDIAANAQKIWYWDMVETAWKNVDTGGVRYNPKSAAKAQELFNKAMTGNQEELLEFLSLKGIEDPERELYLALTAGTHRIPELDTIAGVFKFIDTELASKIKSEAPYFNILSDHVLPLKVDLDKLQHYGKKDFIDFYVKHADPRRADGTQREPKDMQKAAEGIYDNSLNNRTFTPDSAYRTTTSIFGFRKIHFTSKNAEWDFLKRYGKINDGIIHSALKHHEQLLKGVSYSKTHGPNINFSLYSLREHVTNNHKLADASKINHRIMTEAEHLSTALGRGSEIDETSFLINQSLQDLVSYGLTGSSAIRNLTFDQSIYTGLMSHMLTGKGQFEETGKAIWGLFKYGIDNDRMETAVRLFEQQGIMTKIENAMLYRGHIQDELATSASNGKPHVEYLRKAAKFTAEGRKKVSKWSLADRITRASRTSQAVNAGHIINKGVKEGWNSLSLGARNIAEQAGFDMRMWRALEKVERIKFEGKDVAFNTRSIDELSDESVAPFQKKYETANDARHRLKYAYQVLHTELLNHLTSVTSKRGHITSRTSNPKLNIFIQSALRFSNIGLSQWYNMHRLARASAGLDPNNVGELGFSYQQLMFSNPRAFFTVAATNMAGGYMILWAGDILAGKSPREVSVQNSIYALAASGAGGLLSLAYMQLYYNNGDIGTPLKAFVSPPIHAGRAALRGDFEGARRHTGKAAQVALPGANMWYTRRAFKDAAQVIGQYDKSPAEKRYDKQVGRKDLID